MMNALESYPPGLCLRQLHRGLTDGPDEPDEPLPAVAIPVLDLQVLDPAELGKACRLWGLFRLVNHGVPRDLLGRIREVSRQVFALPFETKQALFTAPLSYFWGTPALTPSGAPLSGGAQNTSFVEGLNIPLAKLSYLRTQDPKLESFRDLMQEYGEHLSRVSSTVFEAMAQTLGLGPAKAKTDYFSEQTGFVRAYRYPQCSGDAKGDKWGMEVHTDSSLLSILNQDEVGGLEFLKDEEWFRVEPIPDSLVLNLGDMMQAISDDKYRSVKHRVKLSRLHERHSVCYFVFPPEGSLIQSSSYRPFAYSEFQAQVQTDIKTLGFKVGLARFKKES